MLGLQEIPVEAGVTRFDPKLHEAADSRAAPVPGPQDNIPPGTILAVKRPGYMVRDRVFRPPLVLVKG